MFFLVVLLDRLRRLNIYEIPQLQKKTKLFDRCSGAGFDRAFAEACFLLMFPILIAFLLRFL